MRVDNQNNPAIQSANTKTDARETQRTQRGARVTETGAAGTTDATGAAADASSDISPRAREFARAKEVAASAPDVRQAKIDELKRRIANREYNVKPEAVADRMVQEHLQTHGLG
ncbi:MAG: flagellar biosynthesis anti-sigma factor FlgM [Bdellovibrionales bacterium]|nr:flagellar biosynthesis anti-sigma factor FlgM [Bdellovibrionales bacterium]